MITLSRRCEDYPIQDVMLTLQDGATIDEAAEAIRCFLLACGYHHSLVESILPTESD
jgi:hypothetical protein